MTTIYKYWDEKDREHFLPVEFSVGEFFPYGVELVIESDVPGWLENDVYRHCSEVYDPVVDRLQFLSRIKNKTT